MEMPRPLANLITQARQVSTTGRPRYIKLEVNIITPKALVKLIIPTGMANVCLFGLNHSDDIRIKGNIQPGLYLNQVLPFKDNLYIEVVERVGIKQTLRRYRATPLQDVNPEMEGNHSSLANLEKKDALNLTSVEFQLVELGYDKLKTELISDIFLMGNLKDVVHNTLTTYGERIGLQNADSWRGVDMETPIDNAQTFKQIVIPNGIKLVELVNYLQYADQYGIYSRGIGSYYRKGMWYIYPLFRMGRYNTAKRVLDVYRVPEDVMPSLDYSYFYNERTLSVLSTGTAVHKDGTDIVRQNEGVGQRVVNPDAVMGETGYYYGKGKALTTREDSLSEYKTSTRKSGEELVPFSEQPSSNIYRALSVNASNDGDVIKVDWHNSEAIKVFPGMACKYYYMSGENNLVVKEGTVVAIRTELVSNTQTVDKVFREHSTIEIYFGNKEGD